MSYFVFPVRARRLLQRQMARTLVKTGDLAVWLVSAHVAAGLAWFLVGCTHVCVPSAPELAAALAALHA